MSDTRAKTHTLNITHKRQTPNQLVAIEFNRYYNVKNFARSVENTVRLKAASDEKSVLAAGVSSTLLRFYMVKIFVECYKSFFHSFNGVAE